MMKYLYTLLIPIFCTYVQTYGQSSVEAISVELCNKLEKIDLNRQDEEVTKESLQIISSTFQSLQSQIEKLLPEYANSYKNKSDLELTKIIGRDFLYLMMKNCVVFQRMTMFDNKPVPEITSEIEEAGEYFTKLLLERTNNNSLSQDIVNDCIDEIFTKYVANADTDFIIKFDIQFNAYLLTRCDPYIKWIAGQANYSTFN